MKNIVFLPYYNVDEYLLIVDPHENLRNKIMAKKKVFSMFLRDPHRCILWLISHSLILFNIDWRKSVLRAILKRLQRFSDR